MKKAVVYSLLTTAFIILLINKSLHHHFGGPPPTFNRRLGFKNHQAPPYFDPLVTKMEREFEENISDDPLHLPEVDFDDDDDDETSFSEEGRLNITLRIMILFPLLDTNPKDGFIDNKEMEVWIRKQTIERLDHHTRQELKEHDVDGDGFVSFSEYFPHFSQEEIDRNDKSHGEAGWWMDQFKNADADDNGLLSFYEFRDFLNPEDSMNEKIQTWLLDQKVRNMESDHDRKLNFEEFQTTAYVIYRHYIEFETRGANVPSSTDVFNNLDNNQDGLLDLEELKPIFHYLCPGEISYAKQYALYLINTADNNGDGRLTVEEMIKNDRIFYDTVYSGKADGGDHDEL